MGRGVPDELFFGIPYTTLVADTAELSVPAECEGFSEFVAKLTALPGFPSEEFHRVLVPDPAEYRVVVWRRP